MAMVSLILALLWMGPPELSPAPGATTEQPKKEEHGDRSPEPGFDSTILTGTLGGGARFESNSYGDPRSAPTSHGRVRETTGFGSLQLRAFRYYEDADRVPKALVLTTMDILGSLTFGGTLAERDPRAEVWDRPIYQRGGYFGAVQRARIGVGLASRGRVGVYGLATLDSLLRLGRGVQASHAIFPGGFTAGLRVVPSRRLAMLVGPRLVGILGVQHFERTRAITQFGLGGDLSLIAKLSGANILRLDASMHATAVGREFGGKRVEGRVSLDYRYRYFGLSIIYTGESVRALPHSRQFFFPGQSLVGHTFIVGFGLSGDG